MGTNTHFLTLHRQVPHSRKGNVVSVLVGVPIAVMKHHDPKQLGEEMVYLAYSSMFIL